MKEHFNKVKNWQQFLNESENIKDYAMLYKNVEFLKQIYNDYIEVRDFFTDLEKHLYNSKQVEFGFGFCNETKSEYHPIFKDIANYLIKNNFNINIEQLEKTYKSCKKL